MRYIKKGKCDSHWRSRETTLHFILLIIQQLISIDLCFNNQLL